MLMGMNVANTKFTSAEMSSRFKMQGFNSRERAAGPRRSAAPIVVQAVKTTGYLGYSTGFLYISSSLLSSSSMLSSSLLSSSSFSSRMGDVGVG